MTSVIFVVYGWVNVRNLFLKCIIQTFLCLTKGPRKVAYVCVIMVDSLHAMS